MCSDSGSRHGSNRMRRGKHRENREHGCCGDGEESRRRADGSGKAFRRDSKIKLFLVGQ